MGKTLRQIRKGKRKSIKNRKSVRKGKKSMKRRSYKKMRGGGLNEELDKFVKEATSSIKQDLSKEDIDSIIERLELNNLKDITVNGLKDKLEIRRSNLSSIRNIDERNNYQTVIDNMITALKIEKEKNFEMFDDEEGQRYWTK